MDDASFGDAGGTMKRAGYAEGETNRLQHISPGNLRQSP